MLQKLNRPELLKSSAFVGGRWLPKSQSVFTVLNPATLEPISQLTDSQPSNEGLQAIHHASSTFPQFSQTTTANDRARLLKRWHALITKNVDDLALILTTESGKPLREARGEIMYGASYIEWFAEEARRGYGDVVPTTSLQRRMMVVKQSVGVAAMITPWNFPNAMIARKVAPALAAGCTTLIKPASETPFSALAMAFLAQEAGIPDGVINVLPASRENSIRLGELLCTHPDVNKISFTGSTATGKVLMRLASGTVKRMSMELGGNAPFIVFPDLGGQTEDQFLKAAVDGLMAAKFRNSGQTCVCPNRVFVHQSLHDKFLGRLKAEMQARLVLGNGMDPKVTQGPLISNDACEKIERLIEDAVKKGAKVVMGGKRAKLPDGHSNFFFEPTILTNCSPDMRLANEEIFGPAVAIYPFQEESQVIQISNQSRVGLSAYFYSNDMRRIWRVAEQLQVGMVGVNEGVISSEVIPFGGVKESGFGREGSYQGLDEYLQTKYICMGNLG